MIGWMCSLFLMVVGVSDTAAGAMLRASFLIWPYWAGLVDMGQATAVIDWSLF